MSEDISNNYESVSNQVVVDSPIYDETDAELEDELVSILKKPVSKDNGYAYDDV